MGYYLANDNAKLQPLIFKGFGVITEGSAQLPMLVTDDNIGNRILVGPDLASAPIVYSANELNQYTEIAGGTTVNPLYDLDGNITNDGVFAYSWDAENRLTSVSSNGNVVASFKYDYMSRRYEKTSGAVTHSFIYDGWNLLAEHSATPTPPYSVTSFYIWGLDLSGSLQGAGGIGGLLSITTCNFVPVTCYPLCDANGNITDYVDANGTVVAHREFDAYGNTVAKSGSKADDFNLWFSSKYWDVETGLGYWGYRYYHPDEGRWINRDPLSDLAFAGDTVNLPDVKQPEVLSISSIYNFVENRPVDWLDTKGLLSVRFDTFVSDEEGIDLKIIEAIDKAYMKFVAYTGTQGGLIRDPLKTAMRSNMDAMVFVLGNDTGCQERNKTTYGHTFPGVLRDVVVPGYETLPPWEQERLLKKGTVVFAKQPPNPRSRYWYTESTICVCNIRRLFPKEWIEVIAENAIHEAAHAVGWGGPYIEAVGQKSTFDNIAPLQPHPVGWGVPDLGARKTTL